MNTKLLAIFGVLLFTSIGCSSSEKLLSENFSNKIIIDGNQQDWNGKLKYLEDEKVALGFQNNNDYLYLCLVTSDKTTVMKIMSMGLTIWFKPVSDEQIIGLQYPQSMDKTGPRNLMGKNRNENGNSDFKMTINAMMENQGEFTLVDDEGKIIYASPIGSNSGYKLKVGGENRQFVYEAKVPIGNNNFAQVPINIFPDEKIIVEFETGEIDMEAIRKNMDAQSGMGQASGMRGSGRGSGGTMQGGRPMGQSRMGMERVNFNVELKLSK